MNCKLLRIITGEEVVAEVLEETDDTITVKNGLNSSSSTENIQILVLCLGQP